MFKKYKLNSSKYSIEQIKEACEIIAEIKMLKNRLKTLELILETNEGIRKEIWISQDGKAEPIALLENNHLANIVCYFNNRDCHIPLRILDEIEQRKEENNFVVSELATEEMPF